MHFHVYSEVIMLESLKAGRPAPPKPWERSDTQAGSNGPSPFAPPSNSPSTAATVADAGVANAGAKDENGIPRSLATIDGTAGRQMPPRPWEVNSSGKLFLLSFQDDSSLIRPTFCLEMNPCSSSEWIRNACYGLGFDVFLILEAFWVRQMPTELSDCYGSGNENGESSKRLQLVLLDFRLAGELPPQVRYHFISFIINIGAANGKRAAHHLLQFSWPDEQRCRRPDLLVSDMNELFKKECDSRFTPLTSILS
ncbi:unnamed protein product [Sphagnum balticum]